MTEVAGYLHLIYSQPTKDGLPEAQASPNLEDLWITVAFRM
jgi:hypothetical protein